jgi:hypothetical protein
VADILPGGHVLGPASHGQGRRDENDGSSTWSMHTEALPEAPLSHDVAIRVRQTPPDRWTPTDLAALL